MSPYDVINSARCKLQTLAVPNDIIFNDVSTNIPSPELTIRQEEEVDEEEEEEDVWVRRDSVRSRKESLCKGASNLLSSLERVPLRNMSVCYGEEPCKKQFALLERKRVIVEWQSVATVIDRVLFWVFLIGTGIAYLVILVIVPHTKPEEEADLAKTRALNKLSW